MSPVTDMNMVMPMDWTEVELCHFVQVSQMPRLAVAAYEGNYCRWLCLLLFLRAKHCAIVALADGPRSRAVELRELPILELESQRSAS